MLLSILPPAMLLAVLAARGKLSLVVLAVVLGVALIGGIVASAMVVRVLIERKQSLEAAAEELEAHRHPARVATGDYLVGLSEQRLMAAAEAIVREVETLAEQREELEAILRSMSEGVVVTAAHGEVMLINGVAREMLDLGPEVDYRGRSLVEICRDPAVQQLVAPPSERAMNGPRASSLRSRSRARCAVCGSPPERWAPPPPVPPGYCCFTMSPSSRPMKGCGPTLSPI